MFFRAGISRGPPAPPPMIQFTRADPMSAVPAMGSAGCQKTSGGRLVAAPGTKSDSAATCGSRDGQDILPGNRQAAFSRAE